MTTVNILAFALLFVNCHLPHPKGVLRTPSSAECGFERARPEEAAHTRQRFGRYQPKRSKWLHISRRCGFTTKCCRPKRGYTDSKLWFPVTDRICGRISDIRQCGHGRQQRCHGLSQWRCSGVRWQRKRLEPYRRRKKDQRQDRRGRSVAQQNTGTAPHLVPSSDALCHVFQGSCP